MNSLKCLKSNIHLIKLWNINILFQIRGGNSAQIIEEKKRGILNNIFDTLDSDGDGLISK